MSRTVSCLSNQVLNKTATRLNEPPLTQESTLISISGKTETFKFENKGDTLKGILISCEEVEFAERTSWKACFDLPEGDTVCIWRTAYLDKIVPRIPIGTSCEIEFLGLAMAQPGRSPMKRFDVRIPDGVKLRTTTQGNE